MILWPLLQKAGQFCHKHLIFSTETFPARISFHLFFLTEMSLFGILSAMEIHFSTLMKQQSHIRKMALGLAVLCLCWSGYMMVPASHHLLKHAQGNHAKQHTSTACAWMCMSSSFDQPSVENTNQYFYVLSFGLPFILALILPNFFSYSLIPRAPPV